MEMKWRLIKLSLFLISFTLLLPHTTFCKIVDGIAAIVNDDIITISELNEESKPFIEKILNSNLPSSQKKEEIKKLRKKILNKMIDDTLILQFGKKMGYKVSEKQVDEVIQNILRKNNITIFELKDFLKQQNISYKSYREKLKKEILIARVINSYVKKDIKIPEKEIEKYVNTHFKKDEDTEYHIKQILFLRKNFNSEKEKLIKKILKELKNKKNKFSILAKKFSEGPFKNNGGDLGFFKKNELLPQIRKAVENMKPGDIKVVKTRIGIHIIKLVDIKSKNQKMTLLMKKAEEELKNKLLDKKLKEWLKELRQQALIIVKI